MQVGRIELGNLNVEAQYPAIDSFKLAPSPLQVLEQKIEELMSRVIKLEGRLYEIEQRHDNEDTYQMEQKERAD